MEIAAISTLLVPQIHGLFASPSNFDVGLNCLFQLQLQKIDHDEEARGPSGCKNSTYCTVINY